MAVTLERGQETSGPAKLENRRLHVDCACSNQGLAAKAYGCKKVESYIAQKPYFIPQLPPDEQDQLSG